MHDRPDLTALLGSRICHDLISPIGAISNGVELMMMSDGSAAAELELVAQSVASANARIRFFRVAFGVAGDVQRIGHHEIRAILKDLHRTARVTVRWETDEDLLRAEAKLAFLLLMCLESAMPFGGAIAITREDGTWRLHGTAGRWRIEEPLWQGLAGGVDTETPPPAASEIHFVLAAQAAALLHRRPSVTREDGALTVTC